MRFSTRELLSFLAVFCVLGVIPFVFAADLVAGFASLTPRDKLVFVGVVVTISLWILARLWELYADWRRAKRSAELAVQAIYAEICYNVRDLEQFLAVGAASRQEVFEALESGAIDRVHVTDARHTFFYRESLNDLRGLTSTTIAAIVAFYSELERIKVQVDSIQLPSFVAISAAGRANYVDFVWATVEDAIVLGYEAAYCVHRDHPALELDELDRPVIGDAEVK